MHDLLNERKLEWIWSFEISWCPNNSNQAHGTWIKLPRRPLQSWSAPPPATANRGPAGAYSLGSESSPSTASAVAAPSHLQFGSRILIGERSTSGVYVGRRILLHSHFKVGSCSTAHLWPILQLPIRSISAVRPTGPARSLRPIDLWVARPTGWPSLPLCAALSYNTYLRAQIKGHKFPLSRVNFATKMHRKKNQERSYCSNSPLCF